VDPARNRPIKKNANIVRVGGSLLRLPTLIKQQRFRHQWSMSNSLKVSLQTTIYSLDG
jgi:hypothetical protein